MCGIASIFAYHPEAPDVSRQELRAIRDFMEKRGPDGKGEWYSPDNRVGLGHRRLAIIDLSEAGSQPMCNEDGTVWITYNGEIYNYQVLRTRLQIRGHRFRSTSDTEVIIHGYEEWGIEELLNQLRGMFAFAIHDSRTAGHSDTNDRYPRMIIARDPFGIKPLYYANDGKTFRVASQVRALLAGGQIDTSPEPAGHVGFFLWGHVSEPYTLYKGIRSLPAGSYMRIHQSPEQGMSISRPISYCSVSRIFADAEHDTVGSAKEEVHDRLRFALLDTVQHHLVADVPVGVFLSSGIDSGTLVGLASEISTNRIHTVTLAFSEYAGTLNDESVLSAMVADRYHTIHDKVSVEKQDFREETEALLYSMDQPTIDGVNSYFVAKAAVKTGLKVALSGLGGDELFGGYPSFSQVPKMARILRPFSDMPVIGRGFRAVSVPVLKHFTSPKYAGLLEYGGSYGGAYLLRRGMFMPWELPEILDGEMVREGWTELNTVARLDETVAGLKNDHLKVAALEMQWYMKNQLLRDTDWASMAHSLEVRVPLVDIPLVRAVSPMFSSSRGPSKQDFASAPLRPLPPDLLSRRKTGFTVPVREWFQENRNGTSSPARGLRGWAKYIYGEFAH